MMKPGKDGIGQLLMPPRDVQTETILLARLVVVQPFRMGKNKIPIGVLTYWDFTSLTSSLYLDEAVLLLCYCFY